MGILGFSQAAKRSGREVQKSLPSIFDSKTVWICTSNPHACRHGVDMDSSSTSIRPRDFWESRIGDCLATSVPAHVLPALITALLENTWIDQSTCYSLLKKTRNQSHEEIKFCSYKARIQKLSQFDIRSVNTAQRVFRLRTEKAACRYGA